MYYIESGSSPPLFHIHTLTSAGMGATTRVGATLLWCCVAWVPSSGFLAPPSTPVVTPAGGGASFRPLLKGDGTRYTGENRSPLVGNGHLNRTAPLSGIPKVGTLRCRSRTLYPHPSILAKRLKFLPYFVL